MFRIIKSWFDYSDSGSKLPLQVSNFCDVIFCQSKHINRWVLYFRWEHQHAVYELEKINGLIKVTYSKNEPPINYDHLELNSKIYLRPKNVYDVAMNSSLNGHKDDCEVEICQKFIEEMCNKLGIELSYDENNIPDFLSYFFKADVYFCHRKIPYINSDHIAKRHWALYFSWKHKQVRYELGKDSGYIKAEVTDGDLPDVWANDLIYTKKRLRPEEVHSVAMNCSLNNQLYSAGWRNCQSWVQEVAGKLDMDINYDAISGISAFIGHLLPVRLKNAKPN